jgi:RNA polymerase sigma-70 factor (ECF subfamily)
VRDQDMSAALADDLEGSFEHVVVAYQHRLYAFSLRLTGNPQDAEEITQDAFVRAYRALATFPASRLRTLALRPWLYQIALNVFRNRVRYRKLHLVPLDQGNEQGDMELEGDKEARPDMALERAELKASLEARVAALPERYRLAVVLRHIQGLGYSEMAVVLKQPIGTVKANVHRGVRMLRDALDGQQQAESSRAQTHARRRMK